MVIEPNMWLHAKFTRANTFDLEVSVFESDSRGPTPPSLQLLGAAMRALHFAMGGAPAHSEALVSAGLPSHLAVPGGTLQTVVIAPMTSDTVHADAVYEDAFVQLEKFASDFVGALGTVTVSKHCIEVKYGPGALAGVVIAEPEPEGRRVNLQVSMTAVGKMKL